MSSLLNLITAHWFDALQTAGIVGGLFFTGVSLRTDANGSAKTTIRRVFSAVDRRGGMLNQNTAGEKACGSREQSAAFQTITGTRSQPTFFA